MPVKAKKEYIGVARDSVSNYKGMQIVYASWDHHLLFAAPFLLFVSPQMRFSELLSGPLSALLQADPDAQKIDWTQVQWMKSTEKWTPDFNKTLAENGIGHKDQIRFQTPALRTLTVAA